MHGLGEPAPDSTETDDRKTQLSHISSLQVLPLSMVDHSVQRVLTTGRTRLATLSFLARAWNCQRVWLNTLPLPKPNAVAGTTSNTNATLSSWPWNAPLSTSKCQSG